MNGNLKSYVTMTKLFDEIVESKAKVLILRSLTGRLSAHEIHILTKGSSVSVLVDDGHYDFISIQDLVDSKIAVSYGLLDE